VGKAIADADGEFFECEHEQGAARLCARGEVMQRIRLQAGHTLKAAAFLFNAETQRAQEIMWRNISALSASLRLCV
jgi:hypothetical protein